MTATTASIKPGDGMWMKRAIEQARRGWGMTRPNPHVGAVLVRDGRVIGEGFHPRAGEPHAERFALAHANEDPRGATLYVTLEPCNHMGRTPPCSAALVEAGIARMVFGQRDPNLEARGGVETLLAAGIEVAGPVLHEECLLLNPAFNTSHMLGRPLLTLKWAMSLDGCTSCDGGHSIWITGDDSRAQTHAMRAGHDATIAGIGAALRDGSRLSVRHNAPPPGPELLRILLDTNLRLPPEHPLLAEKRGKAVIVCASGADPKAVTSLESAGATIWQVMAGKDGRISIPDFIAHLHAQKVQSAFVEGGRTVAGAFMAAGMVDRVAGFVAPVIIGAGAHPQSALVSSSPIESMEAARRLHHIDVSHHGEDILMQGWLTRHLFPENPSQSP